MCSVVQGTMLGAGLGHQSWCHPSVAVTGNVTVAKSCWAEQTCRNFAAVVVVAGNVPGLDQMETLAVERAHEACCTVLGLVVAQGMWRKTFYLENAEAGMGWRRTDMACLAFAFLHLIWVYRMIRQN